LRVTPAWWRIMSPLMAKLLTTTATTTRTIRGRGAVR
jgi:hypothetical protein